MTPETHKIPFAGALIELILDDATVSDLLTAAGQPPRLQIPAGCNTVSALHQIRGLRAIVWNQTGFAPNRDDNERQVNGMGAALILAPEDLPETEAADILETFYSAMLCPDPEPMTQWQRATADAEARALMVLEQVAQAEAEHGQRPDSIPLADYPTSGDYYLILGDNPGWSHAHHRRVNIAMKRLLRRHKLKARLVPMVAHKYHAWLKQHGKTNTPAHRAAYAATLAK